MRIKDLSKLSDTDLNRVLRAKQLQGRLPKLKREAAELQNRLDKKVGEVVDLEGRIAKLLGCKPSTNGYHSVKRRARNKESLRQTMATILKKRGPLHAAKVAEIALTQGFKTTARNEQVFKANAANVLRLSKEFVKGSDGKYALKR